MFIYIFRLTINDFVELRVEYSDNSTAMYYLIKLVYLLYKYKP